MKPAKSSNRHLKPSAREHLPALSEAATAWSPRLRGRDGPAASLRTADSLGSRSANSRPPSSTAYAKYIGRVGALAVALGVSGAVATTPAVAWANESSSPTPSSPTTSDSSPTTSDSSPTASAPASDESSIRSSSTTPISTTSSEHSTDDESGGRFTKSGASASPSQTVTTDESGVIVRSSGGAHTSGTNATAPSTDDNKPVDGRQEGTAAAPDLEQPTTLETESTLQAPPGTQFAAPPAAPIRTIAPTEKHSDTKQLAPPAAPTRTIARAENGSDTKQVASLSADGARLKAWSSADRAAVQLNTATPTAGETNEWTDQPVAATFTTPPAAALSAPEPMDLMDAVLAPFQGPSPAAPTESPVLWAVLGWVRRRFTGQFANHTPVADLVQTTQMEPLGAAEAAPVEGVIALAAADPPINAGVAAEQVALPRMNLVNK